MPPNIAVAGIDGVVDAIAGGISASIVFATLNNEFQLADSLFDPLYSRLEAIDNGEPIIPLSFWYHSSAYTINKKWGITYQRTAWAAVYGGGVGTTLTTVLNALLSVSLILASKGHDAFKGLLGLVNAVRADLAAVLAQLLAGVLTRSDHLMAIGLHAGSAPNFHF